MRWIKVVPAVASAINKRTNPWRGILPPLLALAVSGVFLGPRVCSRMQLDGTAPLATAARQRSASSSATTRPFYPRARWRLAQPSELEQVTLWVSHIVIAHRDSKPDASPLRPHG